MKAAIFNPYWDTLGGGEKYCLSFAKVLVHRGYEVDIEWAGQNSTDLILQKFEDRFGIKLENVRIVPDIKRGDGYDLCFWVSDGSIPMLKARNNILHFQVPFKDVGGRSLLNKMKLFRINKIVCNSYFTKNIIDEEFGIDSTVIYPPVDANLFKPKRKENMILSVGRFSRLLQNKRQDILINIFKKLYDQGAGDWKLVLAGGSEVGDGGFVNEIKLSSSGYPIKIIESPKIKELKELYGKARIFWTAAGYGIDIDKEPKKAEHFGITLIEAMGSGAVPLAFNAGGFKEIIEESVNGYLWNTEDEILEKTKNLIKDNKTITDISKNAIKKSKDYSIDVFRSAFEKLI